MENLFMIKQKVQKNLLNLGENFLQKNYNQNIYLNNGVLIISLKENLENFQTLIKKNRKILKLDIFDLYL